MANQLLSGGTDQDMLSQTETEDTDSGEVSSDSVTGSDTSGSSLTSTDSADSGKEIAEEQRVRKLTNVSVDLTDVTALEDNASQGEDSLCEDGNDGGKECINSSKKKQSGNSATMKGGLYDIDFSKDWYNHDCFKSYWQHYNQVMSWCQKHNKVCDKLRKKCAGRGSTSASPGTTQWSPYSQYFHPYSFNVPSWNHTYLYQQHNSDKNTGERRNSKGSNSKSKSSRRNRKAKHRRQKSLSSSEVTSCETQTESSEEFQMEISQDMIDFFAKTQAHRKERGQSV